MITFSWRAKEISVLSFRWYFNKCGLNCWFHWNAWSQQWLKLYCALTSLTFGVQSIALSIEWNDFSDGFSVDTDWNLLLVDCPEMAFSKNSFFVQSFSRFIDEVRRFRGLAWLNIVGILSGLRLNWHNSSSNSAYKRKNTKICKMVLSRKVQFLKTIRILDNNLIAKY